MLRSSYRVIIRNHNYLVCTLFIFCLVIRNKHTHYLIKYFNCVEYWENSTWICFSVKTDMIPDGVKSRLFIANVGPLDSGNYTCFLQDVAEASVSVHVLNGKTGVSSRNIFTNNFTSFSSVTGLVLYNYSCTLIHRVAWRVNNVTGKRLNCLFKFL